MADAIENELGAFFVCFGFTLDVAATCEKRSSSSLLLSPPLIVMLLVMTCSVVDWSRLSVISDSSFNDGIIINICH